jgi:xanthine/CO dehydrogenase XdhC/CoxF family maturation factor
VLDESTAAVVMTHNAMHDLKLIEWLLEKRLKYLGLLGPRHRTEQLLGGVALPRLRTPVGLDLGADNPEEIALAIVAEITAVMHGRPGVALSSRDGPIHAGSPEFPRVMSKGEKPILEVSACRVAGS